MHIGKNIAKYRKARGFTQVQLGDRLGVSNQSVSKWESETSMPDILLLPKLASALGVSLEALYGIDRASEQAFVCADHFPLFCHHQLHELFFHHTQIRFTHVDASDEAQLAYQKQKLNDGCRIGCISNIRGAAVLTGDFAFVDCDDKTERDADLLHMSADAETVFMYLSRQDVRTVLLNQYVSAIHQDKAHNAEFTVEEMMHTSGLARAETLQALRCLEAIHLNEAYTDPQTKVKKYVLQYSTTVYALAICKLAGLLAEADPTWTIVRDTSMICDYAFTAHPTSILQG